MPLYPSDFGFSSAGSFPETERLTMNSADENIADNLGQSLGFPNEVRIIMVEVYKYLISGGMTGDEAVEEMNRLYWSRSSRDEWNDLVRDARSY